MKFQCPYGFKTVAKVGSNFTWESSTVNICDGICDSCDRCAIDSCEFYDISPEAHPTLHSWAQLPNKPPSSNSPILTEDYDRK